MSGWQTGVGQMAAQTTQKAYAESACNVKQECTAVPRLVALSRELSGRIEKALSLRTRLECAMDFVEGAQPKPPCGAIQGGQPSPSDGVLGELERQEQALYAMLDGIDEELRRLERIVG